MSVNWENTDSESKVQFVTELREAIDRSFKSMREKDTQFDLYGSDHLWIMKPGTSSRGRGIHVYSCLDTIKDRKANNRDIPWIVQKYMENSLLIKGRKFDIRQWVNSNHARY